MLEIAAMEETLRFHQKQVIDHKHYFANFIKDKQWIFMVLMIPAFIVGWIVAGKRRIGLAIKQISEVMVLTTVATVRKKLWQAVSGQ